MMKSLPHAAFTHYTMHTSVPAFSSWDEVNYDLNAWTLPRKPFDPAQGAEFVPGELAAQYPRSPWPPPAHPRERQLSA